MQILILVDVQYLRSVSFSIEKGSNSQHHSPMKIPPTEGILLPLNAIGKTLDKLYVSGKNATRRKMALGILQAQGISEKYM